MIKRHFQSTTKNISPGYKEHFSILRRIFQSTTKNISPGYKEYFSQLKEYLSLFQMQLIFSVSQIKQYSQKYEKDLARYTEYFSLKNELSASCKRVIDLIVKNLIVENCRGQTRTSFVQKYNPILKNLFWGGWLQLKEGAAMSKPCQEAVDL